MCTLVWMVWDATEPVMCKGVSECKTVPLGEEYLKSLTQRCTESLSSSLQPQSFSKHSPQQAAYINRRGWPWLCEVICQP